MKHLKSDDKSSSPSEHTGFTRDLSRLETLALESQEPITIGELETMLQGRGMITLALIFALPFIQPIPIPGLSLIFGSAIMGLGLKVALGSHGKLPEFIRRKSLSPQTVSIMARGGRKIFSKLERWIRKRYQFATIPPWSQVAGVMLVISGFALAIPFPPVVILSNTFPAFAVVLICLAMIERDGLMMLIGLFVAVFTWFYFAIWGEVIWVAVSHLPGILESYGFDFWKKWNL